MEATKSEIREFIVSNFLFGEAEKAAGDEVSFLESGIVDSTGVLELVAFVEQQFGITVNDRELLPENFDSIGRVARYVVRKLDSKAQLTN